VTLAPHLTEEQLSAHIDSALDSAESAAVAAHLFACRDCGARLEQLQATSRAVSGLPVEEMPRAVDFTFIREPAATAGAETGPRSAPGPSMGLATRFLRARTPAWATAGLAAAAVVVLAVAVAPGLHLPGGGGASTVSGPAGGLAPAGGGQASTTSGDQAAPRGQAPAEGGAAPGSLAQQAAANQRAVTVPNAGGMTLAISAPSQSARRGDTVPVGVSLGGAAGDQAFSAYSLTLAVLPGQPAGSSTVVGSSSGSNLVVRAGGDQGFTFRWVSTLGTQGPGTYTLLATFVARGQSTSVSIPINLS
jgi:hypothetical protein